MIELLMLINAERAKPLIIDPVLTERAELRAEKLCELGQWSHKDWQSSFTGLDDRKYRGENLARGFRNHKKAHDGLMGSPTHKSNIVKVEYTKIGIGEHKCRGKTLVVELFTD